MKLTAIATFLAADISEKIPAVRQVVRADGASNFEQVMEVCQAKVKNYPAVVVTLADALGKDDGRPSPTLVETNGTLLVLGRFSAVRKEGQESVWDLLDQLRQYFMLDLRYYRIIGDNVLATFTGWRPIDLSQEFPGVTAFAVDFKIEDRDEPSQSGLTLPPGYGADIINAMPEVIPAAGMTMTDQLGVTRKVRLMFDAVNDKHYLEIV